MKGFPQIRDKQQLENKSPYRYFLNCSVCFTNWRSLPCSSHSTTHRESTAILPHGKLNKDSRLLGFAFWTGSFFWSLITEGAYVNTGLLSCTGEAAGRAEAVWNVDAAQLSPRLRGHRDPTLVSLARPLASANSKCLLNRKCKMGNSFHFLHSFKSHNIAHMFLQTKTARRWFECGDVQRRRELHTFHMQLFTNIYMFL